jgi:hypothetical protein
MYPDRGVAWGGAFNGQPLRQALFLALIRQLEPAAIVETGTYLGPTTEFMAETGLPIFTIEAHPRRYGFARARLWRRRNVTLLQDDSWAALLTLFDGPLRGFGNRTLFFYLDAHWNDDLPLAEEIEIIFARCPAAVVMVDDFRVPRVDGPPWRRGTYGVWLSYAVARGLEDFGSTFRILAQHVRFRRRIVLRPFRVSPLSFVLEPFGDRRR